MKHRYRVWRHEAAPLTPEGFKVVTQDYNVENAVLAANGGLIMKNKNGPVGIFPPGKWERVELMA